MDTYFYWFLLELSINDYGLVIQVSHCLNKFRTNVSHFYQKHSDVIKAEAKT